MCGIHMSISKVSHLRPSAELQKLICQRGPDFLACKEIIAPTAKSENIYLTFTSTVLALRGGYITEQPLVDQATGSVFCWNGEAWKIDGRVVEGNDGEKVFQLLLRASSITSDKTTSTQAVLATMSTIAGPFAFIYYDKLSNCLYFGRDRLGRRSLLHSIDAHAKTAQFSSLAEPGENGWAEVEADGLYRLSYDKEEAMVAAEKDRSSLSTSDYGVYHYSWNTIDDYSENSASVSGALNREIPNGDHGLDLNSAVVGELEHQLETSLRLRVTNVPRPPAAQTIDSAKVAVLFSGGLDCTVLARMAHDLLPVNQQIDLLNVAFENPRVLKAAQNTQLKAAKKTKQDIKSEQQSTPALGVNQASDTTPNTNFHSFYEECPDRVTGRKAFEELRRVCKDRIWRFVEINIPYAETISHRDQVISLIHPHNTEMDLSIAYALYFASRGSGSATTDTGKQATPYTTTARVLLSGLGADELFAGYTRHATAFNRSGYEGLLNEIELDVSRLGKRNLGRDDRVISHWGREVRFPYLDESFVNWALSLPVWEKCDFGASIRLDDVVKIEPGKKVLRLLAHRLGLVSVAQEKKRAIQFGARTAKMETGRTKGTTVIS